MKRSKSSLSSWRACRNVWTARSRLAGRGKSSLSLIGPPSELDDGVAAVARVVVRVDGGPRFRSAGAHRDGTRPQLHRAGAVELDRREVPHARPLPGDEPVEDQLVRLDVWVP